MKFRTEIALSPCPTKLLPQSRIMLAGSCFAEHVGERMSRCFPSGRLSVNPCGVLYNPASLLAMLNDLLHL